MSRILLIETSTSLCSVALADGPRIAARCESSLPRAHASSTAPFVKKVLDEAGISARELDAVCVSAGPGSYTGLRVGVSTAKGICFAAGVPLLSVGTLELLVWQAVADGLVPDGCRRILPMIDARRMEVYTAVFSPEGERLTEVEPRVVEPGSFREWLDGSPVLVIGDAADKCRPVLQEAEFRFVQTCPRADAMLAPALREFQAGHFRDSAYFEPFYLKDFIATVSRKKLF